MNINELYKSGINLFKIEKFQEAKNQFNKILEIDNKNIDAYYKVIDCEFMLSNYELMKDYCKKIISIDKKQGRAYWVLSIIENRVNNNLDKSLSYINRAIYYGFSNEYIYNTKGNILKKKGEYEDAIKCYETSININPLFYRARMNIAEIYISSNKIDKALKCYEGIILNNPERIEGYNYKFLCLLNKRLYNEAEEILIEGINRIGKNDIFINNFIHLYKITNRLNEALLVIEKNYNTYKDKVDLVAEKAAILGMQNKIEEAIESIKSVEENKYNDKVIYYLSYLYIKNKEYENASKYLYKLVTLENALPVYKNLALYQYPLCLKLLESDNAKEYFEVAIKHYKMQEIINPYDKNNMILKVLTLKQLEKYKEAIEYVDYMLSLDENWAEAYAIKGYIYTLDGEEEKGKEYLLKAKSINSNIDEEYLSL